MIVCFFLFKTPGGHAIFFRCIWVAIPVDWVMSDWVMSSSKKKLQNIGVVKAKKTRRQQYSLNDDGKYPKLWVMFLNGVIGYQSPNSQGVARTSPLSPIMELENENTEWTRLRGNIKTNCWEKHVRTFMEVYLLFRPTLNWFQKPQTTAVNTRGWPRILTTKFIFWLFEISS